MTDLPDDQVIVKATKCDCGGYVRVAVKHEQTARSKRQMAKEAMEYNLSVVELPLLEYRGGITEWCQCKKP